MNPKLAAQISLTTSKTGSTRPGKKVLRTALSPLATEVRLKMEWARLRARTAVPRETRVGGGAGDKAEYSMMCSDSANFGTLPFIFPNTPVYRDCNNHQKRRAVNGHFHFTTGTSVNFVLNKATPSSVPTSIPVPDPSAASATIVVEQFDVKVFITRPHSHHAFWPPESSLVIYTL